MSQPPSNWPQGAGYAAAAGGYVAPIPVQPLGYTTPVQSGARPGMLTAIGVISIVVACLSVIGNLMSGMYGLFFLAMAQAGRAAPSAVVTPAWPPPPPPTAIPQLPTTAASEAPVETQPAPQIDPAQRGLGPDDRATAVSALSGEHAMINARKVKLDALLAEAGRDIVAADKGIGPDGVLTFAWVRSQLIRCGEAEDSETKLGPDSTGRKADYFQLVSGWVELNNDEGLFVPADGSPEVRVTGDAAPADAAGADGDGYTSGNGSGSFVVTPTAPGPAAAPQVLTAAQAKAVVQEAQSSSGGRLNAAQANALQSLLQSPTQQWVGPADVGSAVSMVTVNPDGSAAVYFSRQGWVHLASNGQVLDQFTPVPFAPFASLGKMDTTPGALVIGGAAVDALLAIFLFIIGIMVMRDSPRGAALHKVYAWLKIPLAVAGAAAMMWMIQELTKGMAAAAGPGGAAAASGQAQGFLMAGIFMAAVSCIYPVALLIVLRSRAIREYYHSVKGGGSGQVTG